MISIYLINKENLIINKYYLESIMPKMVSPYINGSIGNNDENRPHFSILNLSEGHEKFLTRGKDEYTFSTIHNFKGIENQHVNF